jgi:transposase-like protein
VRRAIQQSQDSIAKLAARDGLNPQTIAQWQKRAGVHETPMGPKPPHATVLTQPEEPLIVTCRRQTLLPLDDDLQALPATIPHPTRSALHRCVKRHAISRLPASEGD